MSRLDDLRLNIDVELTVMAQGFKPMGFIGQELLPIVPATGARVRYPVFGKESFVIPDTRRALRAEPVSVDFAYSSATAALEEHSAQAAVDRRESEAAGQVGINAEAIALQAAKRAVALYREKEIAALVLDTSIYDASHVIAVANAWNTSSGDPVADINSAIQVVEDAIGVTPNVVAMHKKAWRAISNNPNVKAFLTDSVGPVKRITSDLFAGLIGVERVLVTNAKESTDGTTFTDMWTAGSVFVGFTATAEDAMSGVPSFGFNLQRRYGNAQDGDLPIIGIAGRWDTTGPLTYNVWYMEEYKPVVTLADAGALLTGVV